MSRSRCSLHMNKLEDFAKFCEADGWKRVAGKGAYEVLRMTKTNKEPLIVHTKNGAKEHLTTWGMSAVMLGQWFRNRPRPVDDFCTHNAADLCDCAIYASNAQLSKAPQP